MNRTTDAPDRRQPVAAYTATELHRILVEDAVLSHATELRWAIAAYTRIGQLTRRGSEDAYLAVLDEVETLSGHRALPVYSGPLT